MTHCEKCGKVIKGNGHISDVQGARDPDKPGTYFYKKGIICDSCHDSEGTAAVVQFLLLVVIGVVVYFLWGSNIKL